MKHPKPKPAKAASAPNAGKPAKTGRSAATRHNAGSGPSSRAVGGHLRTFKGSASAPLEKTGVRGAKIANRAQSEPKAEPQTGAAGSGARSFAQRLALYRQSREQTNPLLGLTLVRAVWLAQAYFRGEMADLQWTYFHIEGSDADMIALIELTLARLQEMDWDVVASPKADETVAERQRALIRERLDNIDNLYDAIDHLALARFRGFAHCEKYEGPDGQINHLELVDQWNVVRDGLKGAWKYNPAGAATSFATLGEDMLMPPERFVYREVARPINRIALFKFVRSILSDGDWDAFAEIYNIPSGVIIGPPDVAEENETEYEAAAEEVSKGGSGYLPHGSQYIQNKAPTGASPFKERLDHLSEKLVLAGTGGRLTMLTDATGLGSGASDAHSQTFDSIASAEARRISEVINRDLVKPWLEAAFPGEKQVAYFRLAANEETDTSKIIEDVSKLAAAGFDLDEGEVTERTGWTVKKKAPPPAPASPFGGPAVELGRALANRIRNRAEQALPDKAEEFLKTSLAELAVADRKDQEALLARLAEIDAITDEAAWLEAMARLDADFPALFAEVVPAAAKAALYHKVNATALVDGAVAGAASRKLPVAK